MHNLFSRYSVEKKSNKNKSEMPFITSWRHHASPCIFLQLPSNHLSNREHFSQSNHLIINHVLPYIFFLKNVPYQTEIYHITEVKLVDFKRHVDKYSLIAKKLFSRCVNHVFVWFVYTQLWVNVARYALFSNNCLRRKSKLIFTFPF